MKSRLHGAADRLYEGVDVINVVRLSCHRCDNDTWRCVRSAAFPALDSAGSVVGQDAPAPISDLSAAWHLAPFVRELPPGRF